MILKNEVVPNKASIDDVKSKIFPIFFMFISLINLVFCLSFIFFIDIQIAFFISMLSYFCIMFLELQNNIKSPITIFIFCLYITLFTLTLFGIYFDHRTGVIIFSLLAILVGGLLILGKPFTSFYSSGRGIKSLHYTNSGLWFVAYILSLIASIYFVPEISFILVPYFICVLTGITTIFFSLCWFGPQNTRKKHFHINDIEFHQLSNNNNDQIEKYHQFFIENIVTDEKRKNLTMKELADDIFKSEADLENSTLIFCAFHHGKIVGCLRCVLANKTAFPIEHDANLYLTHLRKYGHILQAGRFSIAEEYRERPEVMTGLFKCLIELALEKDISFIFGNAAIHRVPLYMKLGFNVLYPRSDSRSQVLMPYGTRCVPIVMNFSKTIIKNREDANRYGFMDYVNRYLIERWYKRAILRYYFRPLDKRPWEMEISQIREYLQC